MDKPIPKLREEIELFETGVDQWTLFDRATGKYYRLSQLSFLILTAMQTASNTEEIVQKVSQYIPCTTQEVDDTIAFCVRSFLIQSPMENLGTLIGVRQKKQAISWLSKLTHTYLFFKIHLIDPDKYLTQTIKWVEPFFSKTFLWVVGVFLALNTIFIFNRLPEFFGTLTNFASLEGLLYMGLAIVPVKLLHELGHAYTAKRYGCRVPSMGIAFMVFYPMPYTETSDAWRLPKHQRMEIALAGIKTEMVIASIAMFFWLILPEGGMKSTMFFIVGVSLISTLVVNLTPFMRFDGYYALSDYLGIENLHNRAFAQAKAFVKRYLWGIEVAVEPFGPGLKKFLIAFAFKTWLYRLVLFSGIAYLVYSHTFKVLGIILFWIEVWYFMLRPVVQEFKEWYGMREEMNLGREQRITWGVIAGLVWILFLPHTSSLTLYGVIDADHTTPLFSKYDGEVKYVHPEGAVKQGELILEVESVDNRLEQERAQRKQTLYERQASNAFLSDETLQDSAVFDQSATAEAMRISAAKSIDEDMNLYAPSDGYLRYERKVSVGQFVGMAQEIGRVVDPTQNSVTGFVEDVDMSLLHVGTKGEVLDTLTLKRFDVVVQGMEMSPVQMLDEPLLNSMYGGGITVGKENVPQRSLYKIRMDATMGEEEPLWFQRPAQIKLVVHYDSLIQRLLNATVSVFISESAF